MKYASSAYRTLMLLLIFTALLLPCLNASYGEISAIQLIYIRRDVIENGVFLANEL